MNKPVSPYQIEMAMSAFESLRARLSSEDPDLAAEFADAEGTINDILARLLRGSVDAGDLADAARARAAEIKQRQARYERRRETLRGTAFAILDAMGLAKVELPDLTASLSRGVPSLVITDETALPDEFVRTKREPDRLAIAAALKDGNEVPGAEMSNNLPRLMIRTA